MCLSACQLGQQKRKSKKIEFGYLGKTESLRGSVLTKPVLPVLAVAAQGILWLDIRNVKYYQFSLLSLDNVCYLACIKPYNVNFLNWSKPVLA